MSDASSLPPPFSTTAELVWLARGIVLTSRQAVERSLASCRATRVICEATRERIDRSRAVLSRPPHPYLSALFVGPPWGGRQDRATDG